jgi:hypothetical protein
VTQARPRSRGHHARSLGIAAVALTSTLLIGPVFVLHSRPPVFCSTGLPISTVDGQTVVLQDHGRPGRHKEDNPCIGDYDSPNGVAGFNTLGFDCKLRDVNGLVVGTSTPNRADGTCGQPD